MPGDQAERRRQQRGSDRRQAILDGAVQVLTGDGPGRLSARAIATAAGVPLAAISYYFESVDDIVAGATAGLADRWIREAAAAAVDPATTGLRIAVRLAAVVLPAGPDSAIRTRYEQLILASRAPALAAALADLRPQLLGLIEAVLADQPDSEAIVPSVVLSVIDGATLGALSEGEPDIRGRVVAELDSLLGRPAPTRGGDGSARSGR